MFLLRKIELSGTARRRPVVTIQEGSHLKFFSGGGFVVRNAELHVRGKAGKPVTMSPVDPKGHWRGLSFHENSKGDLRNVILNNAHLRFNEEFRGTQVEPCA